MRSLQFQIIEELEPGEKFSRLFNQNWPAYRAWYLDEGEAARPTYLECRQAFKQYMPELYPLYERILDQLGCDDLQARFLSLYCPPAFYSGCSQLILNTPQPALIRNYDFPPILCEGVILQSRWLGRRVIAMTDCVWGVLDGMNEAGLAASIAYGGRLVEGKGFSITIVLRYVLETCTTVDEAIEVLRRVPVNLDYNIALVDRRGQHSTLFIAPDRDIRITPFVSSTNHQGNTEFDQPLFLEDSIIRLEAMEQLATSPWSPVEDTAARFLYPPLYRPHSIHESGTLYTAVYTPIDDRVSYLWPHARVDLTFDNFHESKWHINYEY